MNLIELPDTILSQHKLHITPYPVTAESVNNLRTIAVREEFKEQPENYAKYRHQMRQEFETNIMVNIFITTPVKLYIYSLNFNVSSTFFFICLLYLFNKFFRHIRNILNKFLRLFFIFKFNAQ